MTAGDDLGALNRRRFLQSTGAVAVAAAVGDVAAASPSTYACGDTSKSTTKTRTLDYGEQDTYTFVTALDRPCQVTYSLSGPSTADFDLYVTFDGRTPTTDDYDAASQQYDTAEEEVVIGADDVSSESEFGVLVDAYDGRGEYELYAEELGEGSTDSTNDAPHAEFYCYDTNVDVGEETTFEAYDSYDSDGRIVDFDWDFDDGTEGSGEVVSHSYDSTGSYDVVLTVTDDDGATDTASLVVQVEEFNDAPDAEILADNTVVRPGQSVDFDGRDSSDPDGNIVAYDWSFGDGATGTGRTAEHAYDEPGEYTVELTVTDDDDATDTATQTIRVDNDAPEPSFTLSSSEVEPETEVTVDASGSSDPNDSITAYRWDFGDGSNGSGETAAHSYAEGGTYTIQLTVEDEYGATATATRSVEVLNDAPNASFTLSDSRVEPGDQVRVDASGSSEPESDDSITEYRWQFGDGYSTTGETATHTYEVAGTLTIKLTVEDQYGGTDTATKTVDVVNDQPVAKFSLSETSVEPETQVSVDASESYDPDDSIVRYSWDFGDGVTTTGRQASHRYSSGGTYDITLTVEDEYEETNSTSKAVEVVNDQPIAAMSLSSTDVDTGTEITAEATDSRDPDGPIREYRWNFGDGTTRQGERVTHSYSEGGTYTVELTVVDEYGATASATRTVNVQGSFW